MPIYNRLRQYLHATQTSQNALARAIGVRPNTIAEIANNRTNSTDWRIWEKILDYFGERSFNAMFYIADECEDKENR